MWQRCVELGVSPTFHTAAMGWTDPRSRSSNYVFNHIGMFAIAGEMLALSLFMGGVPQRFPQLRFAFQEGGVAWAAALLREPRSATGRSATATRSSTTTRRTSTARRWRQLFEEYGSARYRERLDQLDDGLRMLSLPDEDPATLDEFARVRHRPTPTTSATSSPGRTTSGARPTIR